MAGIAHALYQDLGYEDMDEFEDALNGTFYEFLGAMPHVKLRSTDEGKHYFQMVAEPPQEEWVPTRMTFKVGHGGCWGRWGCSAGDVGAVVGLPWGCPGTVRAAGMCGSCMRGWRKHRHCMHACFRCCRATFRAAPTALRTPPARNHMCTQPPHGITHQPSYPHHPPPCRLRAPRTCGACASSPLTQQ